MCNWIVERPKTATAITEAIKNGTCTTPEQVEKIAASYGDKALWTGILPEEKPVEEVIIKVTGFLREIGVPAHIKGYRYAREAIIMAVEDGGLIDNVTKGLYPSVAEKFNTTSWRVERDIRHAIEVAWDRGEPEKLYRYFGQTISATKGTPTNSEFVAMAAEYVSGRAG